jgi:hypothetical protein
MEIFKLGFVGTKGDKRVVELNIWWFKEFVSVFKRIEDELLMKQNFDAILKISDT